ncbi:DUF523 domain-containing protein [Wenyingzhuangia sp. 2_MG-2023]|uniref:DUF523 domain-containing protein n=1 Tax=Wenyingzhuangia sp. 2_MG-2023 TaxID=3062639 RepID=UPI0026E2AF5E|nr:DUF523 domain-containing protein [Wenyingzhuangia sp. 2_MG-2023]MDO6738172.1 DUF523 domain-containing protein [Wenyingzhuangia sp. 2_MG-2023]
MKLVSACLAGIPCRFDGKAKKHQTIAQLIEEGKAIAVCPEELGGLPTPRIPAEKQGEKIINKNGIDVTKAFEKGAQKALQIALKNDCTEAILKSNSPSCGCGKIYDGSFTGKLTNDDGIFCKVLKENKIKIYTENEI